MTTGKQLHLHLLSDSTGETLDMVATAGLAQFDNIDAVRHLWPMVRSEGHLARVLDDIEARPGVVLYTLVNPQIRRALERECRRREIHALSVLDPVLDALAAVSGEQAKGRAGRQHALDAAYFARVDAIQFTIAHDDGIGPENWEEADIVLAGVSRTSKTPTSIYLANRGYKVANVPLVLDTPLPEELSKVDQRRIVGLIIDIDSLQRIRKNRLEKFGQDTGGEYASLAHISKEIEYAEKIFKQNRRWPVFNVTERALEETASEIVRIIAARLGLPDSVIF